ncbi:hypothetical protein ACFQHO_07605 [Actinomadura yumaensis]
MARVEADVRAYTGGRLDDDAALLVLRFGRASATVPDPRRPSG